MIRFSTKGIDFKISENEIKIYTNKKVKLIINEKPVIINPKKTN